jgi:hypothetical protein
MFLAICASSRRATARTRTACPAEDTTVRSEEFLDVERTVAQCPAVFSGVFRMRPTEQRVAVTGMLFIHEVRGSAC